MQRSACESAAWREIAGGALRPGGVGLTRRGLALCGFAPGARLLDVGCGPGTSLELVAGLGYEAIGLDRSARLLRDTTANAVRLRGDFAALPLADACLDGILCECALSLASDPLPVLDEWRRTLKSGGRVLLSDIVLPPGCPEGNAPSGESACGFANAARSLESLAGLLEARGFGILALEDHSGLLAQLAARIVWHCGSLRAFTDLWKGEEESTACDAPRPAGGTSRVKYGYALVIAEKRSSL